MIRIALSLFLLLSSACGDDDGAADTGVTPDTGASDARADRGADASDEDAGSAEDAGEEDTGVDLGAEDAGEPDMSMEDAGEPDMGTEDAGAPDMGPSACDGIDTGRACRTARDCDGRTHDCVSGRCTPRNRMGCRAAGTNCPSRTTPECVVPAGSRTGICLSTEEAACVCSEFSDAYDCGRAM